MGGGGVYIDIGGHGFWRRGGDGSFTVIGLGR